MRYNNASSTWSKPIQGAGIGLRAKHLPYILQHRPKIPWFEVLTDNYLNEGGIALQQLERIRADYPIVLHGVGLSIGSVDSLNWDYLKKLKQLICRLEPAWVSDHLCWISLNRRYFHELLPLPYTEETLKHVVQRIQQVQDFLQQSILIENVSSYFNFKHSTFSEAEFLNQTAEHADCFVLLDINNIFVSASNQNYSPETYLSQINPQRVQQFHLAGYEPQADFLLDAHSEAVHDPVWQLYEKALARFGAVPASIEWDNNLPEFSLLQAEAAKAQEKMQQIPVAIENTVVPPVKPLLHSSVKHIPLPKIQYDITYALHREKISAELAAAIQPVVTHSVEQSIAIYRYSMREALLQSLSATFPVCERLVGEGFFRGMALCYVKETPSFSTDIGDYGYAFAEFIAHFTPADHVPYLACMAQLEWAWWLTMHSVADLPASADWQQLLNLHDTQQAKLIFQLTSPSQLLTLDHPVHLIWQMLQTDSSQKPAAIAPTPTHLLVWRNGWQVQIDVLTRAEATLLQMLQAEENFTAVLKLITANKSNADFNALLPKCITRGWITGFKLPAE